MIFIFKVYVETNGQKLRCGYTTGACSAGAAKAAAMILFNIADTLDEIEIASRKGINIKMPIENIEKFDNCVECTILKDGGDDPDVTDGIEIKARIRKITGDEKSKMDTWLETNEYLSMQHKHIKEFNEQEAFDRVILKGGIGVGVVTKDGLFIPKGQPAINPMPIKMIKEEVLKVLPEGERVEVIISVPKGREIAKKTFNPRLGIEDGISILGTTGIVNPMSEESLKASIKLEINQKALNNEKLVLAFGNLGDNYARKLGYNEDEIVICSNFIGFALETCVLSKVKSVIIIGHIGKMSKIAFGCFNTHSKVAGVRLEVIALELALLGYDISLVKRVLQEKTCEGAVNLLGSGYDALYENIGKKILEKSSEHVYGELKVDAIMYYGSSKPTLLWKSGGVI